MYYSPNLHQQSFREGIPWAQPSLWVLVCWLWQWRPWCISGTYAIRYERWTVSMNDYRKLTCHLVSSPLEAWLSVKCSSLCRLPNILCSETLKKKMRTVVFEWWSNMHVSSGHIACEKCLWFWDLLSSMWASNISLNVIDKYSTYKQNVQYSPAHFSPLGIVRMSLLKQSHKSRVWWLFFFS